MRQYFGRAHLGFLHGGKDDHVTGLFPRFPFARAKFFLLPPCNSWFHHFNLRRVSVQRQFFGLFLQAFGKDLLVDLLECLGPA